MAIVKIMNYLIDIGHPAHVHYFRNLAERLIHNGNNVIFTCRDKDVTLELLRHYNLPYISLGRTFRTIPGKIFGLVYFTLRIFIIVLRFKPSMLINATVYSAFVARILGKPHISFEDTFNMEQVRLYLPFTSCVLTGKYKHPQLGNREISYSGYQELLYLHPALFVPDRSVIDELGLKENEPYVIMRFVSWTASHDIHHSGISLQNKIMAVEEFSKYARVFISSETQIPESLEKYKLTTEPHRIHDVLAFASLVFGESATMASEGAMLGIPGIFLDNKGRFYTRDLEERYDLVFNFSESESDQLKAIEKGKEILTLGPFHDKWSKSRKKMLSEQINVTDFLTWFVRQWPESYGIMKSDPSFQERFK